MIVNINPIYLSFSAEIANLPQSFDSEGKLLHSGRNQVKKFDWDGKTVIVKRYKKPNFFLRLQFAFLKNCKAMKAYKFGLLFNQANILTPTPIAYVIEGKWPIIKGSYFVCEPVEGTPLRGNIHASDEALIHSLAEELARMHAAGLMHGDLNFTNIYRDDAGRFHFIDTNRSKIKKNPVKKDCAKNLMRLTHDRFLLTKIAKEYARIRGWNPYEFASMTVHSLTAFERKKAFLKKLKDKFLTH